MENIHILDSNIPDSDDFMACEPYYLDLETQVARSLWRDYQEQDGGGEPSDSEEEADEEEDQDEGELAAQRSAMEMMMSG